MHQNFSFWVLWKKESQISFEWTWRWVNDDRIIWANYSFNRWIHCLSCSSSFVISCAGSYFWCVFFYLRITLCTRLVEIKGELQSSRRNLKLKGSVSLSFSFLCFSNTPADTTVWERACLFIPSSSTQCLSLSDQSQTQSLTKTGRKMTRRWLNQLETKIKCSKATGGKQQVPFEPFQSTPLHPILHFYHINWAEEKLSLSLMPPWT